MIALGIKALSFDRLGKELELLTKKYTYKGKQLTLSEISKATGLSYELIYSRLRAGDTVEQAIRNKHERKELKQVDLLESIPKASCFNNIELNKQDKVIIAGLISDYLEQKAKGLELLDKKRP